MEATGRCAQCHREETAAVVHQFERSQHSQANITCYDCHQRLDGQDEVEHYNFVLARAVTSLNCQACHRTEYGRCCAVRKLTRNVPYPQTR